PDGLFEPRDTIVNRIGHHIPPVVPESVSNHCHRGKSMGAMASKPAAAIAWQCPRDRQVTAAARSTQACVSPVVAPEPDRQAQRQNAGDQD
ncbi:hypothetical protein ABTH94_19940, partial [Acinetobacter baumannii]